MRPFTLTEAREAGLERWHLRTGAYRRVGPRTYVPASLTLDPITEINAGGARLSRDATFSHATAAWLHHPDLAGYRPLEVTVPIGSSNNLAGLRVHRANLKHSDKVRRQGLTATSMPRTIADLSARLDPSDLVVLIDQALNKKLVTLKQLRSVTEAFAGRRGNAKLRQALALAEPLSESPMETRLRLLPVRSRLPSPLVQAKLTDTHGRFLARADLYFPSRRLAVEYDGSTHKDTIANDNRRRNSLLYAGYRYLCFTASDVFQNPRAVVSMVRGELARSLHSQSS